MSDINDYRNGINEIDTKMAELFEERLQLCRKIAAYKQDNSLSIRDQKVEDLKVSKQKELIKDDEIRPYYVNFIRSTMDISSSFQEMLLNGMKVAYIGDESTGSYRAAKKMFPNASFVALNDYKTAYEGVESGEYNCAVLPLENSLSGEVGKVMDLMYQGSLSINQIYSDTEEAVGNEGAVNTTRYAAFTRSLNTADSKGRDNEQFIITFTVKNEAGALASTLNIIGAHGYNMRSLRSRPLKSLPWSYYFYIEAEGNINSRDGKDMLRELSAICADLKLVGTFH
ncbi:MAG TPA: hypothetical protein DCY81_08605 [Lachnospiraceae bacterium]|nr:hypothetical protein [Lachnospiraceae bacterium]